MHGAADKDRWTPEEGIRRLRMAANRLCPAMVLGAAHGDEDDNGPTVTLPQAVALCDASDLNPGEGDGGFLLVLGIRHEIQKRLLVLAAFPEGADRAEIEHDVQAWLESQTNDVEDDIAEWWGEPVAGLIRQKREQPDFFEQVLSDFEPDQEPCPSASM